MTEEELKEYENMAKYLNGLHWDTRGLGPDVKTLTATCRSLLQQNKTLLDIAIQSYKFHCSSCGHFAKSYSSSCPVCGKEGYYSGSFSKDVLREWFIKSIQK